MAVNGVQVGITQATDYPWNGVVKITVLPEQTTEFTLSMRIPGWSRDEPVPSDLYRYIDESQESVTLTVNGEESQWSMSKGYAQISRKWQSADVIELSIPMPVRRVLAHENVEATKGRIAVERGPLVYCAEWVDNNGRVSDIVLPDDAPLEAEYREGLFDGVVIVHGETDGREIALIPYYAWSHRGAGEMAVWLPRQ